MRILDAGTADRLLRAWPVALVAGVLLWAVLLPNLFVIGESFRLDGVFSLGGYRTFISDPSELEALWGSLWISLGSVLLSALVGVPLAFPLLPIRIPGPGALRRARSASRPSAAPRRRHLVPLSLRGERDRDTLRAARPRARASPVAARRGVGHPLRPRVLDVRLLLSLHSRRPRAPRRLGRRGRPVPRSQQEPGPLPRHAPDARAPRSGPPQRSSS